MASWEYFIYSKSGKYSPEEIAQRLIAKGYEEGINCKATAKQEINRDHFMVLGERFEENINVPQGKEGVMFSSGNGNEEDIKNIFNLFQRRDIEVKLNYKFGDIDYKSYFDDAPLDVNGKTYFAELKSEKEMMTQDYTPGIHFETQEQFDNSTKYKDTRYHFYNCTFDDIHFSDNVVIGQFEKCRFNRCTFENFDAESIKFNGSVLTDCSIINSNFKSCNFENVGLYQSQISKSDLTNANFATANMKRTRFDENNLSAVKFHGATLNGVIITEPTINKPIEGLFTENITWDGATYEEIETLRKNIFSRLKLEPVTFAQKVEAVERSLEPLPEAQIQEAEPSFAEQKIAEVKEKLDNPQTVIKSLTNEEFDILKGEIVDIAKNYQADPKLAAELFAFKTQFYQYSLNNTLLIHLQNPHATFVASFTKWKSMGYSIKKGAKHMKISRPIEIAKFPRDVNGKTKMIDVKNANAEEKAKIANGEIKVEKVTKFVPHQVFDISQTTCPPEDYPKIYSMGVPDIEKAQLYECIAEYAKDCGFSVAEEDMSSISLNGYYKPSDDSIHINSLLQDSKKLETMAHELAHGVLHKTTTQPTEIAEFEAESFGTMLQRKLGIPVSEDSKRYIKNYFEKSNSLTKAKFDMNDTLNRLSKAFKHVSTGIDNKIEEMGYGAPREKGRSLSQAKAQAVDPVKISSNFTQAL